MRSFDRVNLNISDEHCAFLRKQIPRAPAVSQERNTQHERAKAQLHVAAFINRPAPCGGFRVRITSVKSKRSLEAVTCVDLDVYSVHRRGQISSLPSLAVLGENHDEFDEVTLIDACKQRAVPR